MSRKEIKICGRKSIKIDILPQIAYTVINYRYKGGEWLYEILQGNVCNMGNIRTQS